MISVNGNAFKPVKDFFMYLGSFQGEEMNLEIKVDPSFEEKISSGLKLDENLYYQAKNKLLTEEEFFNFSKEKISIFNQLIEQNFAAYPIMCYHSIVEQITAHSYDSGVEVLFERHLSKSLRRIGIEREEVEVLTSIYLLCHLWHMEGAKCSMRYILSESSEIWNSYALVNFLKSREPLHENSLANIDIFLCLVRCGVLSDETLDKIIYIRTTHRNLVTHINQKIIPGNDGGKCTLEILKDYEIPILLFGVFEDVFFDLVDLNPEGGCLKLIDKSTFVNPSAFREFCSGAWRYRHKKDLTSFLSSDVLESEEFGE